MLKSSSIGNECNTALHST